MKSLVRLFCLGVVAGLMCSAREVSVRFRVPLEADGYGHVTRWESAEDGARIDLGKSGGKVSVRWHGAGGHSRVSVDSYLLEHGLSQLAGADRDARALVLKIGYDGDDQPLLRHYLFWGEAMVPSAFHVRLKRGVHDYILRRDSFQGLRSLQCRGGEGDLAFRLEGIYFLGVDRDVVPIPISKDSFRHVKVWKTPLDGADIRLVTAEEGIRGIWSGTRDGHSKIILTYPLFKDILRGIADRGQSPEELILRIGYAGDDLPMLKTYLFFIDSEEWYFPPLRLKRGVHDYVISRRRMTRGSLPLLREVQFRGGAREFTLESLWLRVKTQPKTMRKLTLLATRKSREVLPDGVLLEDFLINFDSKQVSPAGERVSLRVRAGDGRLWFHGRVASKSVPKGVASEKRDAAVWSGDCLELFVAPLLDNRGFSQVDVSATGCVYDGEFSFDPVEVAYRNRATVTYDTESSVRHQDGVLDYRVSLPLKEVRADLARCPMLGFQAGINLTESKRYYSWNQVSSNLKPEQYGILYFNERPFGAGQLSFSSVSLEERECDLLAALQATGFPAGRYELEVLLTQPDHSVRRQAQTSDLKDGALPLRIPGVKDLPGTYTLWVLVRNSGGQVKPFAVNLNNQTRIRFPFGQKKLFPFPKGVTWGKGEYVLGEMPFIDVPKGASARTRLTADLLSERIQGLGVTCRQTVNQGRGIVLRLDPSLGKSEGYRLSVTPEHVVVTGADERGLYYGTVTLHQLMKLEMRRRATLPIPCVEIVDYPDLPHRVGSFALPDQVGFPPFKDYPDMDRMLDYLDRFVAGNKMNVLKIYGFETLIYFDAFPKLNYAPHNRRHTLKDMERLGKFCSDRFIDLMLCLPAGGHDYWLSNHNQKALNEPGWRNTGNVSSPLYRKIYFTIADQLIRATKCRYFSAQSDEWWFHRDTKVSPLPATVNGKPRAEVFLDFHLELHEFLRRRNVRMAMHEDMINPVHSGSKFDTYKVIDRLPKDIILLIWLNLGDAVRYFSERGFECWGCTTGWVTFDGASRKSVKGFGSIVYGFSREWRYHLIHSCVFHNIWFMAANYAWNFNNRTLNWNYDDLVNDGDISAATCVFAESSNPHGSPTVVPLDLGKQVNSRVKAVVPGRRDVCHIPMEIANSFQGNCIRNAEGSSSRIPVGKACSSVVFLHNAVARPAYKARVTVSVWLRQWPWGFPVADYEVVYADGSRISVPVRLSTTIYYENLQHQAGNAPFCRGLDISYDRDLRPYFMYQYEWVNPHPEKVVKEILVRTPEAKDFTHQLFAVSVREVK